MLLRHGRCKLIIGLDARLGRLLVHLAREGASRVVHCLRLERALLLSDVLNDFLASVAQTPALNLNELSAGCRL